MKNYQENYELWLNSPVLSEDEREQLRSIADNEELKELRFAAPMDFGTAGLRSTMYMGPGCMNVFTVAQTTQAIAELITLPSPAWLYIALTYAITSLFSEVKESITV